MNTKIVTLVMLALLGLSTAHAQVGINTDTPHPSSFLDVDVTNLPAAGKLGFLPPRMTTTERDAINGGAPAEGLVIFNTDTNCLQWFNGSFWYNQCDGAISAVPNPNLTVANETYQGVSVIDMQGIGYNGETVPTTSTITVDLTNTSGDQQNYGLLAIDATTGLQYTATGLIPAGATIAVVLNNNQPDIAWDFYGTINMTLEGASNNLALAPRIDVKSIPTTHPDWTFNTVTYGGQTFMDRNLGARRPAEDKEDVLSYGNHYQWGRPADGHEITVWKGDDPTMGRGFADPTALNDLATNEAPGISNFIITNLGNGDWLDTSIAGNEDPTRWTNNPQGPCPTGYHVPTRMEWTTADGTAHPSNNNDGWDNNQETFDSPLKFPSSGNRLRASSNLSNQGVYGNYWATDVGTTSARGFFFDSANANSSINNRATGLPVRCLLN